MLPFSSTYLHLLIICDFGILFALPSFSFVNNLSSSIKALEPYFSNPSRLLILILAWKPSTKPQFFENLKIEVIIPSKVLSSKACEQYIPF